MNTIQKYHLGSTVSLISGRELVNPNFFRGNVTYENEYDLAHIEVVYEVTTTEAQQIRFNEYYTVDCTTDWTSADAKQPCWPLMYMQIMKPSHNSSFVIRNSLCL
jgi:hypothetical protein